MKLNLNNKKKGFTLVEILLVVGFIAIASIGIYTVYQKVDAGGKANTESRNLDTIRAGVKNLYATSGNYSSLNQDSLIKAGLMPDSMVQGAGTTQTLVNTFGGTVTIKPTSTSGTGTGSFDITYPNVPTAVCVKLAPSAGAQFEKMTIEDNIVKDINTPIDANGIATQCSADKNVTMVFTSY